MRKDRFGVQGKMTAPFSFSFSKSVLTEVEGEVGTGLLEDNIAIGTRHPARSHVHGVKLAPGFVQ
jgi:hypothetical protein